MGSPSEYACLIEELHCFDDALRFVDRLLKTIPMNETIHQAIEIEITTCCEQLEKFSVSWKPEEVQRFKRKLSHHRQNINRFLYGLQMYVSSDHCTHNADAAFAIAASPERPVRV